MNLNRQQKEKVLQFRGVTGASEKAAVDCLKCTSWALEPGNQLHKQALDYFFSSGMSAQVTGVDTRAIDQLFQSYKESDGDTIQADGIIKFCTELGVEPADIVMLVISFYMNAATMGEFTKDEFSTGMFKMGTDTIEKLRKKLPELRAELRNEDRFRDIYNYAYMFSREKGQKCVQLDTAVGMWQLLLTGERSWPLIDDWCEYLTKHHNRAISKDTWSQLLDFIRTIKPDFSNFDGESSAWPYLLDEFVDHVKAKRSS